MLLDEAEAAGMGVLVRSALLKGVLGTPGGALPDRLRPLAPALARAAETAASVGEPLPRLALRFVLSDPRVDSVLVGIDRPAYLAEDVAAWRCPPLPAPVMAALRDARTASPLTDPRTWGF